MIVLSPTVAAAINQMQATHEVKEELRFCVRFYSTPGLLFGILRRIVEVVQWFWTNSYWGQSVAFLRYVASLERKDSSQQAAEVRLWKWIEMNRCPQPVSPQITKTETVVAATSLLPQTQPISVQPGATEAVVIATPESEEEADAVSPKTTSFRQLWTPLPLPSLVSEEKPEELGNKPLRYLNLTEGGRNARLYLKQKTGRPLNLPKGGKIMEAEKEDEGFVERNVNRIEQQTKTASVSAPAAQNPQTKSPLSQPLQSSQDLPA